MIYILTSAQSFVLGRKSPFSFELRLLRGGEKNEEMLIISSGGRDGGHQCGVLCDHDLDDLLEFGIPDRSPTRLRYRSHPCSVVLAELWDSRHGLPIHPCHLRRDGQQGKRMLTPARK